MAFQANNINFINNSVSKRTMFWLKERCLFWWDLFHLFVSNTFFAYVLRFVAFFSRRLPSLVLFKFRAGPRRESLLLLRFVSSHASLMIFLEFDSRGGHRNEMGHGGCNKELSKGDSFVNEYSKLIKL